LADFWALEGLDSHLEEDFSPLKRKKNFSSIRNLFIIWENHGLRPEALNRFIPIGGPLCEGAFFYFDAVAEKQLGISGR
jgi:hypothetical protein